MRISDWSSDVCSSDLQRALFVRNGDVFVRELGAGVLRQLTASAETEADPQFSADQQAALWRVGNDWYWLTFSEGGARAVALPRAEEEIGRAARRERVWQYVEVLVGAVSLKKQKPKTSTTHQQASEQHHLKHLI